MREDVFLINDLGALFIRREGPHEVAIPFEGEREFGAFVRTVNSAWAEFLRDSLRRTNA